VNSTRRWFETIPRRHQLRIGIADARYQRRSFRVIVACFDGPF
jgi:hypothetical protein